MQRVRGKRVLVDVEKVERMTRRIVEVVNEHFLQETLTGHEVVLALQTVAFHVMKAQEEFEDEREKKHRGKLAA